MSLLPPLNKSHIAILVHSMNEGGAQKRLVSLANGFVARGHRVDVVAIEGAGTVGRLVAPEVRRIVLRKAGAPKAPRLIAGLRELKGFLQRDRPTVLMAGSTRAHVVAALACAAIEKPPLLVLRAARHPLRHLPWSRYWKRLRDYGLRPIERWAMARADLIIAVSKESAAAIAARVTDPTKVITISNPTITAGFRAALDTRVEHRWFNKAEEEGDAVILGVGRLAQSKDFETLVEAVAIATRSTPVKLILLLTDSCFRLF